MSLQDLIYGERLEEHDEAAKNLAQNLGISIERALELIAKPKTQSESPVDMEEESPHSKEGITTADVVPPATPGVRHMNLGDDSKYLGGIHTGDARMDLANRLRWCRGRCGMLKEVILGNLGVSEETLDAWEAGLAPPSDTDLIIMADLYRVKVDDLLLQ